MEPTSSNGSSSSTSPQHKYHSDRSFSITLIIFHKATASGVNNVQHSLALPVGVGLGLGILGAIVAIWQMIRWSRECKGTENP